MDGQRDIRTSIARKPIPIDTDAIGAAKDTERITAVNGIGSGNSIHPKSNNMTSKSHVHPPDVECYRCNPDTFL